MLPARPRRPVLPPPRAADDLVARARSARRPELRSLSTLVGHREIRHHRRARPRPRGERGGRSSLHAATERMGDGRGGSERSDRARVGRRRGGRRLPFRVLAEPDPDSQVTALQAAPGHRVRDRGPELPPPARRRGGARVRPGADRAVLLSSGPQHAVAPREGRFRVRSGADGAAPAALEATARRSRFLHEGGHPLVRGRKIGPEVADSARRSGFASVRSTRRWCSTMAS